MNIRINTTALVASLVAVAGWAISIELRLRDSEDVRSLRSRVCNIEELITPVLIDHEIDCRLRKLQREQDLISFEDTENITKEYTVAVPVPNPSPPPQVEVAPVVSMEDIEKEAQSRVHNAIQQVIKK